MNQPNPTPELPTSPTYRIVVATDLGDASAHAVRHALTILARIPGSELHLLHVVVDSRPRHHVAEDERLLGDALVRMRTTVNGIVSDVSRDGERVERRAVCHVRLAASAAPAIEQLAFDLGADLVVVGTHGRRGLERLVLGSVAEDLLRSGRVAVLVARPNVFDGMSRTPRMEAASPEAPVHAERSDLAAAERIAWRVPSGHIAGLL